jgi:hypothetical protein
MAHFAEIIDGVVSRVIVADTKEWCENNLGGTWVQTSYNTRGGIHYGQDGQPDNGVALNKNYAGIGYSWDGTGFAAPQPYPSWTLNQDSYTWQAPTPMPNDGKLYSWNEDSKSWDQISTSA